MSPHRAAVDQPPRYWLVVPAAGRGSRFGASIPKQYSRLAGAAVIEHALAPFIDDSRCRGLAIALSDDDPHWPAVEARLLPRLQARGAAFVRAPGGAERGDSVASVLAALSSQVASQDWVMVHDAARPCVTRDEIDRLLEQATADSPGALLAVPLVDTLKRAQPGSASVDATIPRVDLWRALTPQLFRHGALQDALAQARREGRKPTDEAQAIEWAGGAATLVAGAQTNLKITTAADLALAAAILQHRAGRSA